MTATIAAPARSNVNAKTLWWPGVGYAALGAVTATAVATLALIAGVSLDAGGTQIPILGFTQLAFIFSMIGVAIAAGCRRWSANPAQTFVRVTLVLLAVSLLPDAFTTGFDTATRATLMVTHLAVAAVVIPGITSRLH